jgi:hypothetical protein
VFAIWWRAEEAPSESGLLNWSHSTEYVLPYLFIWSRGHPFYETLCSVQNTNMPSSEYSRIGLLKDTYRKLFSGRVVAWCHKNTPRSTDHVRRGPRRNAIVPYASQKKYANAICRVRITTKGRCWQRWSRNEEDFPMRWDLYLSQ